MVSACVKVVRRSFWISLSKTAKQNDKNFKQRIIIWWNNRWLWNSCKKRKEIETFSRSSRLTTKTKLVYRNNLHENKIRLHLQAQFDSQFLLEIAAYLEFKYNPYFNLKRLVTSKINSLDWKDYIFSKRQRKRVINTVMVLFLSLFYCTMSWFLNRLSTEKSLCFFSQLIPKLQEKKNLLIWMRNGQIFVLLNRSHNSPRFLWLFWRTKIYLICVWLNNKS